MQIGKPLKDILQANVRNKRSERMSRLDINIDILVWTKIIRPVAESVIPIREHITSQILQTNHLK